jgi:nucleotide-binding universal stress UspA family protein
MQTVLIPVTSHDRWSRAVAAVAADVEDEAETRAAVVYRFSEAELESTAEHLDTTAEASDIDELAARKSGVNEVIERLEQAGIECTAHGVEATDTDGEATLSAIASVDADRVYMYSRKRTPAGKAIFGSSLQNVLMNATVPVVAVPPNVA